MTCSQVLILTFLALMTFAVVIGGGYYVLSDMGVLGGTEDLPAALPQPTVSQPPKITTASTATPTNAATQGVVLPPTWTPTPTITQIPYDSSQWLLTLEDLTPGFDEVPMEEFGFEADGLLFGGEYPLASVFSYLREDEEFEGLFGFTIVIEDPQDQSEFDDELQEVELFSMDMQEDIGADEILDQRDLQGLSNIGDISRGTTVGAVILDVEFRLDIVVFRRKMAGVFLVAIYLNEDVPVVPVQDAARTLDSNIQASFLATP